VSATAAPANVGNLPDLDDAPTEIPQRRDTRPALLMTAPAVIALVVFVLIPFIVAIWLSLHHQRLNSGHAAKWMGLEQYRRILFDSQFRGDFYRALLNNFTFAVIVVPLQTGLALGLALLLNRPLRAMGVFRTFFFMPVVFPMALVSVVWKLIYSRDQIGLLNSFINTITFGTEPADPMPPSGNVSLDADGALHATITSTSDSVHSGFIISAPQERIGLPRAALGTTRFRITFTTAGVYPYICALHDDLGMKGRIIVLP